ncbi:band 4.1-like protein 4 [Culicoides brevitarsis]|uniref:band 4.1-like protein 4 n=1 Tax=Culicoides brevitarsis TaxID=469753 RepID=UPI00307BDC0D
MYCLCRSANAICVRIILLDETDFLHEIKDDLPAQALLDVVFARLNLIETCYFGLRFVDQDGQTHWLDPNTRISRQLKKSKESYELYFGVKFYAADPCKLVEEITRYQLYLQVKQDILQGRLPVSFELAAELGSYVVQSELGDYDARKHVYGYVSEFRLVANQTREVEQRICELHQKLRGMSPSQCELSYLDKVKWHDMYGVDLHPVLGEDSVEYFLGLTPSGIVVLRNKTTVAHYFWPRIAKVYFKGRYFMLRVCDKNNEVSTYGFETPKKSACKHLWKCCMEHHAFFRLVRVPPSSSNNTLPPNGDLFTIGSRFRSSAKNSEKSFVPTHQKSSTINSSSNSYRIQPNFVRVPSRRQPRRNMNEQFSEEKRLELVRRSMHEVKSISIPQPVETYESPYRSTCSIPAALNNNNRDHHHQYSSRAAYKAPDSPQSSKSVPWMRSHQRGLFGINSSPKSVRSATTRTSNAVTNRSQRDSSQRRRSSSVESHSSNDSRGGKKSSRRRHRRISDNESEFSGRSGRSHNSHRKHRRHRSRSRRSGSENESRRRSSSNHSNRSHRSDGNRASSTASLELIDSGDQWLEAQRKQGGINGVVHQAAVVKSSSATKKNTDTNGKRKQHRKHKSPSDRTKMWSSELARHLQFDLVETSGMTEDQLREIPYTVVETHQSTKKPTTSSLKVNKTSKVQNGVDRIRNYPNEQPRGVNGSIRSESTISSSKDYDRNSGLIRMMSSLSMVDFISPSGSSISPVDSNGLRVSHEHTDSGLGADQDYAYSSERSSDSAKYTNKSSGASVASITTHSKSSHMSSIKSHHTRSIVGEMSTEL